MSIVYTIDKKRDIDGSWKEKNKKQEERKQKKVGAICGSCTHTHMKTNAKTFIDGKGERQSWVLSKIPAFKLDWLGLV